MAKNTATSNQQIVTVKPSEASRAIEHMIKVNLANADLGKSRRGLFIWGPPGISKSETVKQVARKHNLKVIDIRLTQMEPTDLRGIPVPVEKQIHAWDEQGNPILDANGDQITEDKVAVRWAIPEMFPTAKPGSNKTVIEELVWNPETKKMEPHRYDGAIILLDELPNAAPSVQAGSYQLVLDGQLGEYKVPGNVVVMAAGNRLTDKGGTFKMPTPLMNRFTHIEMVSDFDGWQKYALNAGFHPAVVGYLTTHKQQLFEFNPQSATNGFATPRSWEAVSDILREDTNLPEQVLTAMIAGTVGEACAFPFMSYMKMAYSLPNPSDILDGKVKSLNSDHGKLDVSAQYALVISLCYEINDRYKEILRPGSKKPKEVFFKAVHNGLKFMMDNLQVEMAVLGARILVREYRLDFNKDKDQIPCWQEFLKRYSDLLLGR